MTTNLTRRLLILIIFFIPIAVFGQEKYKYKYRKHLASQQSSFSVSKRDTILESNKSILKFEILNKKEEAIPFANIRIKNSQIDTSFSSNIDGIAYIKLPSGTFSVSIFSHDITPIAIRKFLVKENTNTSIKTSLGLSNTLEIALIYSIRKLSKKEIKNLINDLSNESRENELIKNKTCYLMWEI